MNKNIRTDASEGLKINNNRVVWDETYAEIRKLSVKKAMKIYLYSQGTLDPQKVVVYRYGKAIYKPAFDLLKPAHKAQIRKIMNQILALYSVLASC